ncbi:MAG: response regulator transcription factor [Actinobacteria bacterium]|nr:response regulator transcription factor [Actinomycetota bacterium]
MLIVDDHRMFAESLARLLADEGDIEVVGLATSGAQAFEMLGTMQPRVALVDYNMPEQDGITIAAEMKRLRPSTMVVMVTGSTEDRVLLGAIEAGCSGFITKDRAADAVAEVVRGAAAGEALISPALLARLLPRLHRSHRSLGDDLTDRERDTLRFLARGWTNKVIATEMNLSLNTVRNYVQSVLNKLGAHSKLEAVSIAVREGLVDYPPKD